MQELIVEASGTKFAFPPDFSAEVSGKSLLVPQNVADVLQALAIDTAEEFVSFLRMYPSTIANALGWKPLDVEIATASLLRLLHGLLPDEFLAAGPPRRVTFGALDPLTARRKRTS